MLSYLAVFVSLALLDFCWAKYIHHLADRHAVQAGLWSGVITLGSAFAVISYTANHWLLIPAVLGAFVGTWAAVALKR